MQSGFPAAPFFAHNRCLEPRTKLVSRLLPWGYFVALAWACVYVCREAFTREATGKFASMHGEWIGLARLAGLDWLIPRWWPYWGGGAPIEFAYAPLIPFSIAALSRVLHCSPALAIDILFGLAYCLVPLSLYVAMWRVTRAPGASFLAAGLYAFFPLAKLIDLNKAGALAWFVNTLRSYRIFEWDDLPHQAAFALFPLLVWLLARALGRRRPLDYILAGAVAAAMMLASMFGFVLAALAAITVPLALDGGAIPAGAPTGRRPVVGRAILPAAGFRRLVAAYWFAERRLKPAAARIVRPTFVRAALVILGAYFVVSPWAPPSLFRTISAVAATNGESDWSWRGITAFAIVATAFACVWLFTRRRACWPVRWAALFACPMILIPALDHYFSLHFSPQPRRYMVEMEMAIVLALAAAAWLLVRRVPRRVRIVLALPVLLFCGRQVVAQRKFFKRMAQPVDISRSIEYRAARWVDANLPGRRVLVPGSMATSFNEFSDSPQFAGQSYSTAPNRGQQIAQYTIFSGQGAGERDAPASILWLKAFAVSAIAVSGPHSPEYWRPYANPRKFEGVLPVLWREDDTTIYRVPLASESLAHVMNASDVVRHPPVHGLDIAELERYVAALDHSPAPASFDWRDVNHAVIRARLAPGQVVSVQVTYDRGWRASVNGARRAIEKDGIGLMAVRPDCIGDCEIALTYDGGWETKLCWAASILTLMGSALWVIRGEALMPPRYRFRAAKRHIASPSMMLNGNSPVV